MIAKYKITASKNDKVILTTEGNRFCQTIKKFFGLVLDKRFIKDKSLVGYLIRHRHISRARLTAICLFWDNSDINKQELEDAKNDLK